MLKFVVRRLLQMVLVFFGATVILFSALFLFGNPVENLEFVHTLETILGKKAQIIDTPTPASEPLITYADVSKAKRGRCSGSA